MKTVKDVFTVYGNKYPSVPTGYYVQDFRDPRPGEYFLSEFPQYQNSPVLSRFPWKEQHGPRLILKKIETYLSKAETESYDNGHIYYVQGLPIPLDKVEKTYGRAYSPDMIPPWYGYAGFGVPAVGQDFLPVWGSVRTPSVAMTAISNFHEERILLKKKAPAKEKTIRVVRVLEYVGPESWINQTLMNSIVRRDGLNMNGGSYNGPNKGIKELSTFREEVK